MKEEQKNTLNRVLNASGFLFQEAVEHELQTKIIQPGSMWKIIGREHKWTHQSSGDEGYIDLLLDTGTVLLVIECKRVKDGVWLFPVNKLSNPNDKGRMLWTHKGKGKVVVNWHNFTVTPKSHEAMFCVVRGHGEGQIPMLERIASELLLSVEALAQQDLDLKRDSKTSKARIVVPLIITNADLYVSRYSPDDISLSTGLTTDVDYEPVSLIRFRKSLASGIQIDSRPSDLQTANKYSERTVFIMNSNDLTSVFNNFDFPFRGSWPWSQLE